MDLLIDFVNFLLNAMFFGSLVWFVFTWAVSRHLESSQLGSIVQDLDEERLIPLTVEVDQDQYFCYNTITKAFVCQGNSLKEIVERFKLRYPDKSAAIYDGDETAVRVLKKQMKELSEDSHSIRSTS
jgi:hypothetical protein